jgi:lipid A ethanolaminephosphotransferase
MLYVGDHGESLGEYGLYLHGAPFMFAPEDQTRVPMIFWFGRNYHDADRQAMTAMREQPFSHDNVFHTLLGFFEVESEVYAGEMDLLQRSRSMTAARKSPPHSS